MDFVLPISISSLHSTPFVATEQTGTFQMQDGKDMEEATGEKQNCSTIYSQNKHTQEASGRKPEADICVFLVCPAN